MFRFTKFAVLLALLMVPVALVQAEDVAETTPDPKPIPHFTSCAVEEAQSTLAQAQTLLDETIARMNAPADFYVAVNGSDANAGTKDAPFATLIRAQTAMRQAMAGNPAKTWTVEVAGGDYTLDKTLEFVPEDSGRANARATWRAAKGQTVRLLGGKYLRQWQKTTDTEILNRLRPEVRDKLIQIDLKAAGITEYGSPDGNAILLYFDGKPMTVARYPNEGFLKIAGITDQAPHEIHGRKGTLLGIFNYDDERVSEWTSEKDAWVLGYWFWDWSEQHHKIASIDTETKTLSVQPPYHSYGYRVGQWFYGYNLLCEIDQPGEYYIDREAGILYFYPPAEVKNDSMVVSLLNNIVDFRDVSYLTFQGFTLEFSRGSGLSVRGGSHDLVAGCTLRNLNDTGVSVSGEWQTVFGCHLYQLGANGITISGGDTTRLVAGHCLAMNNDVHDYALFHRTYNPGVSVYGVGNVASHNRILNAPHMGMGFGGNDNLLEYNEIGNVCFESNDAGAIYTGRTWIQRGHVLRCNYLHDIQGFQNHGCVGMYLDDQFSSACMYGNVFRKVSCAVMIGGGRDNQLVNNVFIDCSPCLHLDCRGLGWQSDFTQGWINELRDKQMHQGVKLLEPPYSTKYPELLGILDNVPGTPYHNVVARNIVVRGSWCGAEAGKWIGNTVYPEAEAYNQISDNMQGCDPFVDEAQNDFRLKADSPANRFFEPIPFEKIGVFDSPLRAK